MKKPARTRIALTLGVVVLVGIGVSIVLPTIKSPLAQGTASPMQMPLDRKPEYVSPVLSALRNHQWDIAKSGLGEDSKSEAVLTQILRFLDKEGKDPVSQKAIFELLSEHIRKGTRPARELVLATRGLSALDLEKNQQKEVRILFQKKVAPRLAKDLLPLAFLGTHPYPDDQVRDLVARLRSADHSAAQESLYLLGQIQDHKSSRSADRRVLKDFWKVSTAMRPHVAKYLVTRADPEMKSDRGFRKVKDYSKTQTGEVWAEVAAWAE